MDPIAGIAALLAGVDALLVFNRTLEDTTPDLLNLDAGLVQIAGSIERLNDWLDKAGGAFLYAAAGTAAGNPEDVHPAAGIIRQAAPKEVSTLDHIKEYTEIAMRFGKIAKEGIEMVEAAGKLSEGMERTKSVVKGVNGLLETLGGAEQIATATGETEGLAGAAEILSGAEAVAGALSLVPGAGWVAALTTLAVGATAAVVMRNMDHEPPQRKDFFTDGLANSNPYFEQQQRFDTRLTAVAKHAEQEPLRQQQKSVLALRNKLLRQDGDLYFDHERAIVDPVYIRALQAALAKMGAAGSRKSLFFDDFKDEQMFRRNFDPGGIYRLMTTGGYEPLRSPGVTMNGVPVNDATANGRAAYISRFSKSGYSAEGKKRSNAFTETVLKGYALNGMDYVRSMQEQYRKQPGFNALSKHILTLLDRAKPEIDAMNGHPHQARQGHIRRAYTAGQRQDDRSQVVINLNKPMIETFTINAKDTSGGMNDFRRKVEEVLLEILNSVHIN